MNHLVSVYLKGGVIAHVQSTNGDEWPRDVKEFDENNVAIPLARVDVTLEPTAEEIAKAVNGRPKHRSAAVLFQEELELVAGKVRYRAGKGQGRAIRDRAAVAIPA